MNMFSLKKPCDVKARVMAVVEERIAAGQKEYDEKCGCIDEDCNKEIEKIEEKRVAKKSDHLATIVSGILKG